MRLIARLDWKTPFIIKPIYFDGLRKVGYAKDLINKYAALNIDEIALISVTSSLYKTKINPLLLSEFRECLRIPLSVGGNIQTHDEANLLIRSGADKVIINTAGLLNTSLLKSISSELGSQSVAVHIQAKKINNEYFALYECARSNSGKNIRDWISALEDFGVGEVIISSVDHDGALSGPDYNLFEIAMQASTLPVILSSGISTIQHIREVASLGPSGIMIGRALHEGLLDMNLIKEEIAIV